MQAWNTNIDNSAFETSAIFRMFLFFFWFRGLMGAQAIQGLFNI